MMECHELLPCHVALVEGLILGQEFWWFWFSER